MGAPLFKGGGVSYHRKNICHLLKPPHAKFHLLDWFSSYAEISTEQYKKVITECLLLEIYPKSINRFISSDENKILEVMEKGKNRIFFCKIPRVSFGKFLRVAPVVRLLGDRMWPAGRSLRISALKVSSEDSLKESINESIKKPGNNK